ncbi:MAG: YbbR-like domain-containing protein [Spirochaetaceae bacterium]|nr:MAG: YbbR-like domain-containing protein [Spirochaetaceae bacterium]
MKPRRVVESIFSSWPAKIISLTAAALLFLFYRVNTMDERFVSVPLQVDPPAGLAISKPYPKSARVTLRGKEEAIFSVIEEDIEVYADFGRFQSEGQFRVPVRVVRRGSSLNIEPLDIRVEPAEISVTLEQRVEKTVALEAVIRGSPPAGYDLVQYTIVPDGVQISGPRSIVNSVEAIELEEIDLEGRTEDFTEQVMIVEENSLLDYPRERAVVFRGILREAVIIKTFENVDIISIDLSTDLRLTEPLPKGSIRIQGNQRSIEALLPEKLRLIVDCGEIEKPGPETLYPQPDIPPEFVVLKFEPQQLDVNFILSGMEEEQE